MIGFLLALFLGSIANASSVQIPVQAPMVQGTDFGPSTATLSIRLNQVAVSTTALSVSTASLAISISTRPVGNGTPTHYARWTSSQTLGDAIILDDGKSIYATAGSDVEAGSMTFIAGNGTSGSGGSLNFAGGDGVTLGGPITFGGGTCTGNGCHGGDMTVNAGGDISTDGTGTGGDLVQYAGPSDFGTGGNFYNFVGAGPTRAKSGSYYVQDTNGFALFTCLNIGRCAVGASIPATGATFSVPGTIIATNMIKGSSAVFTNQGVFAGSVTVKSNYFQVGTGTNVFVSSNGFVGIGEADVSAQLEVMSNRGQGQMIVSISSTNDNHGIMNIYGNGYTELGSSSTVSQSSVAVLSPGGFSVRYGITSATSTTQSEIVYGTSTAGHFVSSNTIETDYAAIFATGTVAIDNYTLKHSSIGACTSAMTVYASSGSASTISLVNNCTISFANFKDEMCHVIYLKQIPGSKTVTWPTVYWPAGTPVTLTTTAGRTDKIGVCLHLGVYEMSVLGLNYAFP